MKWKTGKVVPLIVKKKVVKGLQKETILTVCRFELMEGVAEWPKAPGV